MLGLDGGELFIVVFIVAAVLSWSLWPRAGEIVAEWLIGGAEESAEDGAPADAAPDGDRPSKG